MSKNNLLIDIGNTRIKVGIENSGTIKQIYCTIYSQENIDSLLDQLCNKLMDSELANIYLSSVANKQLTDQILQAILNRTHISPQVAVTNQKMCGLENAYSKPESLGVDRWLALIAAFDLYQSPICVVDCGTAVTVDTINDNSVFIGGLILPGLNLMRQALGQNADALNHYSESEEKNYFPTNTSTGVISGTALSIATLIEKSVEQIEKRYSQKVSCVITGGDGKVIQSYMNVKSDYHPNLVLHGLAKYFRSN